MNTSLLKDYIKRVYELEVSLYKQRTLQEKIRNEISYYSNLRPEASKMLDNTKYGIGNFFEDLFAIIWSSVYGGIFGGVIIWLIFECIMRDFLGIINFHVGIVKAIEIAFIITFIILSIIFYYENHFNYNEIKRKNKNIKEENIRINERNTKNKEVAKRKLKILNQELTELISLYKETKATLDIYYDKNIVFPKYRNLVAISSFHEYLSSGRCSCLEGHEGAYNIFEDEILHKIIIRKLDEVIEHLENIESNQYMLYSAIKESDRETNRIGQELNRVSQRIEENTYVTAYNSNIAAQNTEFLKWVELLR